MCNIVGALQKRNHRHVVWGACLVLGGFNSAFLVASYLREVPSFWTNAGGVPVLLREGIQIGYYPLFGILVLLHTLLALTYRTRSSLVLNLLAALPLALGISYAWGNNLLNLWMDRPLHWHP